MDDPFRFRSWLYDWTRLEIECTSYDEWISMASKRELLKGSGRPQVD